MSLPASATLWPSARFFEGLRRGDRVSAELFFCPAFGEKRDEVADGLAIELPVRVLDDLGDSFRRHIRVLVREFVGDLLDLLLLLILGVHTFDRTARTSDPLVCSRPVGPTAIRYSSAL